MKYVSNETKQVYSISNLKEEIIATIFAYVSRSPKSFRENLAKVTEEKASKFHEKWVLNYGHASVAEHATIHFGIEKVSRLFSSILALSNPYLSITEYSQRYQKVNKDDFYIPLDLDEKLKIEYIKNQEFLYKEYHHFLDELNKIYKNEKKAYENARSLLNLSTFTNLGLTTNARALENALTVLLSSKYKEVVKIANMMKIEAIHSLPTLVKYSDKNNYIIKSNDILFSFYQNKNKYFNKDSICELIDYPNYADYENNQNIIKELLISIKKHDQIPIFFDNFRFEFNLKMTESCYHQFLRHRTLNIVSSEPGIENGFLIPISIFNNDYLKIRFISIMTKVEKFYNSIKSNHNIKDYLVMNSHLRLVNVKLSLKDLYNLINLRLTKEAQDEIYNIVKMMLTEIRKIFPFFINPYLKSKK